MANGADLTLGVSPFASRLARAIGDAPRQRVDLDDLWIVANNADSSLAGASDARERLLAGIREIEACGAIRLPARGGAGWDTAIRPALPRWVLRPVISRPGRRDLPAVVWHSTLGWAAPGYEIGAWTPDEIRLLVAANDLAFAGGPKRVVPLAERSLALLGNEKALDGITRGRLFEPGRLSLATLGAVRTPPPFVWSRVGPGLVVLAVENAATFHSLTNLVRSTSPVGFVVYGGGNAFAASVEFIRDLPTVSGHGGPITAIRYFGDLDSKGLDIARSAADTARRTGLPDILPAVGLYERLVRTGVRQVDGPVHPARAAVQAEWLPESVRGQVFRLLIDGFRIAQESVGTDQLADDSKWLSWESLGVAR